MATQRKPRAALSSVDDMTLGELEELEAAGKPLPESVRAAIRPFTRMFADIARMVRPLEPRGPDAAAGVRALAAVLAQGRMDEQEPRSHERIHRTEAEWRPILQAVWDLIAEGKRPAAALRRVALDNDIPFASLKAKLYSQPKPRKKPRR
jgi:hypothetical protein